LPIDQLAKGIGRFVLPIDQLAKGIGLVVALRGLLRSQALQTNTFSLYSRTASSEMWWERLPSRDWDSSNQKNRAYRLWMKEIQGSFRMKWIQAPDLHILPGTC